MAHTKEAMLRIALMNAIDAVIGSMVGRTDEQAREILAKSFGISPELADEVFAEYKVFIQNPVWDI